MELQRSSSTLQNEIFYAANISPSIVEQFKNLIVKEFKREKDLIDIFYSITRYPIYFISKIVNVLANDNETISNENFINFLCELHTSDIVTRVEILFKIFDFNNDNLISFEDIKFFFTHFYIVKYKSNLYLNELSAILSATNMRNCMTKEIFVNFILKDNSDIFYLFFLMINSDNLFNKEYIDLFIKYNHYLSKEEKSNEESIIDPSRSLIEFALEALNIDIELEEKDELKELEDFENSVTTCISILDEEKKNNFASSKCLLKLSSMNLFKVGATSIEVPNVSVSCKNIIDISKEKIMSKKTSSALFDMERHFCEAKMRKGIDEDMKKTEKVKIVIKDKILFVIKYHIKGKKITHKVKAIYLLNHLYPIIDGEMLDRTNAKKIL